MTSERLITSHFLWNGVSSNCRSLFQSTTALRSEGFQNVAVKTNRRDQLGIGKNIMTSHSRQSLMAGRVHNGINGTNFVAWAWVRN